MAYKLSSAGIQTAVITDSAIFALMARVNKVILGTHAVMANGGLIATAGAHMVALAAKHHSVPVVCVAGLYKLCPRYALDQHTFNDLQSPGLVLPFGDVPSFHSENNVQVVCPTFDYVPPELVSLFITNHGGHQPSYIYRLLAECYHPEDSGEFF